MGGKKGQRLESKAEDLNLVPIMALLVVLIPVLLFAFNFFDVKIQAVSAPRMGSGKTQPQEDQKKPLNLTVFITKEGFTIKKQAELGPEEDPKIFKRAFEGLQEEEYDYPKLYSKIASMKRKYPNEKTINIGAEMTIPWHVVARTIDTTRVFLEKDDYAEMSEYTAAQPKMEKNAQGVKEPVEMFPAVLFVVAE